MTYNSLHLGYSNKQNFQKPILINEAILINEIVLLSHAKQFPLYTNCKETLLSLFKIAAVLQQGV